MSIVFKEISLAKCNLVTIGSEVRLMSRCTVPTLLKVSNATPILLSASGDNRRIMQPAIHIPTVSAAELLTKIEIRELVPVNDPDVLRTTDIRYIIKWETHAVVDFDQKICKRNGDNHRPNERGGDDVANEFKAHRV